MRHSSWAVALLLSAGLVVGPAAGVGRAADEKAPGAKPAAAEKPMKKSGGAEAAEKKPKTVRLTKPWSQLGSLSDDQKTQIAAIHRKALDEIKEVEQREKDEIMAVLTDAQKAELSEMMEKDAAERKMRTGKKAGAGAGEAGAAKPAASAEKAG
jgi:Spy/CpxP family protein refolding chaperone